MNLAGAKVSRKKTSRRIKAFLPRQKDRRRHRRTSASDLLAWYDLNRRDLPWRPGPAKLRSVPGWLSEIMLQQTTVKSAAPYFARFIERWPNVAGAGGGGARGRAAVLGRARLLRARAQFARLRQDGGGNATADAFPATEAELAELPGIGPYTAAAIAAIAFGERAAAVDGNVERVVTRLFAFDQELPAAKPKVRKLAARLGPAPACRRLCPGADGSRRHRLQRPSSRPAPFARGITLCAGRRRGDAASFPARRASAKACCGAALPSLRSPPTAAC